MSLRGSATTSTSSAWVDAVRPQVAVASAGWSAQHGHPSRLAVERLHRYTDDVDAHPFRWWLDRRTSEDVADYREAVYSTAVDGHVVIESDGEAWRVIP